MFIERHLSELTNNESINFKKVNIIIGKNDSGKSYLMRQILMRNINRKTHFVFKNKADFELVGIKKIYFYNFKNMIETLIEDNTKLKESYNQLFIHNLYETDGHVYFTIEQEQSLSDFLKKIEENINIQDVERIALLEIIKREYSNIISPMWAEPSYYYPTIRNALLKIDDGLNDERLEKNIIDEYFKTYKKQEGSSELKIITGQKISFDIEKYIKSNNDWEKEKFKKYKVKLAKILKVKEINFIIRNFQILIVIDGKECAFNEVGEGIQNIVILTFYIDDNQKTANRIFIEEPEINLHPGLQRDFVKGLAEHFNSQIFITTHSPHFVDLVYEDEKNFSVVCVKKENGEINAYNPKLEFFETDELLDVRASSLMLSNCIVWVEGPSDPNFVNSLLKLYIIAKCKKEFSKYCHYNYAYNNSVNLSKHINFKKCPEEARMNLKKISKNSFFIFDFDGEKVHKRNKKLFEFMNDNLDSGCAYVMSDVRTIENIIPPNYYIAFFDEIWNEKYSKLFKSYFGLRMREYGTDAYRKRDVVTELYNYLNSNNYYCKKNTVKSYYNKFKIDFSTFFKEKIENEISTILSSDNFEAKLEILYDTFDVKFRIMIEEVYKFIENCNK